MAKKTKTPVHSEEHMLREQGVAPVWQPQINQEWKHGIYQRTVRLPSVDTRQPLTKAEAAADSLPAYSPSPPPSFKTKDSIAGASFTSPKDTTLLLPSQTKVNVPPAQHKQPSNRDKLSDNFKQLVSALHTRSKGRDGHSRLSSTKQHDLSKTRILKTQSLRDPRRRDGPRNGLMRQARLRYEQEKLAVSEEHQQQHGGSPKLDPTITSYTIGVGRASPFASNTSVQRPVSLPQRKPRQQPTRLVHNQHPLQPPQISRDLHRLPDGTMQSTHTSTRSSPSVRRTGSSPHHQHQLSQPIMQRQDGWSTWIELRVKVFGLPPSITTLDLWHCFSKEGSINIIEIFEDSKGSREGKAMIRYRPPPARPFWQIERYPVKLSSGVTVNVRLELEPRKRSFLVPSPVRPQLIQFSEVMTMNAHSLDFGFMYDPRTMMCMHQVKSKPPIESQFRQNVLRREIVVEMQVQIRDWRVPPKDGIQIPRHGKYNRTETYQFRVPFSQLQKIYEIEAYENTIVLLISLETPPRFFRKVSEIDTHEETARVWSQNDAWYRQTDIVYNPKHLKSSSLTLKKSNPVIDIGRWTTYRFVFDRAKNNPNQYKLMCEAFKDHNIDIVRFPGFKTITNPEPAVWDYIDKPLVRQLKMNSALEDLIEDAVSLPFPVRYQLEVCISQGCLNEHNLSQDFVHRLMASHVVRAQDLLEYVANQKKRICNPMEIFDMTVIRGSASRPRIPSYCAYTRSATVTPSTVYYNTPTVETSNRVIRQYAAVHGDRFLRVRFTDEKLEGRINPTDKDTSDEIFTRIKRTMINGITIGDRHYEFLAFGNSQFREHGAYFFAPTLHLTTEDIRRWMGMFKDIRIVAKHAARLGQCFSTTRAISGTKVVIEEIEDIWRNGKNFSDGVGKISELLAQMTASELGITHSPYGPPSVYQFRLGGCKGVLAVSPEAKKREIHIRESQYKFPAVHEGLEIIRWSQFASANLNRQLILVLSALGVPDDIFIGKLKMQLVNLERAMNNTRMSLSLLQKDIDANQMTLVLAGMVVDGFQSAREPFVVSLLQLWRAWSIKYLKEKARILVGDGALLLGCLDETATLKGHYNEPAPPGNGASVEEKTKALPEVFVQIARIPDEKPQAILGPMLLARNPSLHPGDIRVVCGVDVPELHYLRDVVVLPQTGDRDLASMCSGGDLDGDDYLVIWDRELLPYEWNHEPMDYTPPEPVMVDREVTVDDITSFFVTYMKNDMLPRIAHAHVALADFMDAGVKDQRCLRLAALHSMAVDYVKTGVPARMPRELAPRKWPHFMEKKHKPKEATYISHKILGKLYDQVERVDFVPAFDIPFDERILRAYNLKDPILRDAANLKREYDAAMHRIMAQHDIKTEFEVWSTFVLHHSNQSKDYKFHEEIGQLSSALKDQFRGMCYRLVGNKSFELMGPFVAAMYKVTQIEINEAIQECRQVTVVGGQEQRVRKMDPENMPLMSFPWLFTDILGKIANGNHSLNAEGTDPAMLVRRGTKVTPPKKSRAEQKTPNEEDTLETAEGVTHRGEVLELFDKLIDLDDNDQDEISKSEPKQSSEASIISADDVLSGDSVWNLLEAPNDQPLEDGNVVMSPEDFAETKAMEVNSLGMSSDNLADVYGNDEDLWSSAESVSGEMIRVYHGPGIGPSAQTMTENDMLLDFGDEATQEVRDDRDCRSSVRDLAEMIGSENEGEEEALTTSHNEAAVEESSPDLAKVSEHISNLLKYPTSPSPRPAEPHPLRHDQAQVDTIAPQSGVMNMHDAASVSSQGSDKPASNLPSPAAESPLNHDPGQLGAEETPDLSDENDEDGAEEVVVHMDVQPSAFDKLADFDVEE